MASSAPTLECGFIRWPMLKNFDSLAIFHNESSLSRFNELFIELVISLVVFFIYHVKINWAN